MIKSRKKKCCILAAGLIAVIIIGVVLIVSGQHRGKSYENESTTDIPCVFTDGTPLDIIEEDESGEIILPDNPQVPEGWIFSNWEISENEDGQIKEIKVVGTKIPDESNVIAIGGGYGKPSDRVTLPLLLRGNVELCALEMEIHYNSEQMKFVEFTDEDDCVVANCPDEGIILLNYVSTKNTTGDVDFCNIVFEITGDETDNDVTIEVKKAARIDANGKLENTECFPIFGKVNTA